MFEKYGILVQAHACDQFTFNIKTCETLSYHKIQVLITYYEQIKFVKDGKMDPWYFVPFPLY